MRHRTEQPRNEVGGAVGGEAQRAVRAAFFRDGQLRVCARSERQCGGGGQSLRREAASAKGDSGRPSARGEVTQTESQRCAAASFELRVRGTVIECRGGASLRRNFVGSEVTL